MNRSVVCGHQAASGEADRQTGDGDALQRDAVDIDAFDVVHLEPHVDDRVGGIFRRLARQSLDRRLTLGFGARLVCGPPARAWP